MNLILYIIFLGCSVGLVLAVNYYRKLFAVPKDKFKKEEIIDFKAILTQEFKSLLGKDVPSSYTSLALGATVAFVVSHMGGLYGAYYESYFFNSLLVPAIAFLAIPYLRDNFYNKIEKLSFLKNIFFYDIPFLFGVAVTIMAQMVVVYGLYHALSFLWVLVNYISIGAMIIYRIYSYEKSAGNKSLEA